MRQHPLIYTLCLPLPLSSWEQEVKFGPAREKLSPESSDVNPEKQNQKAETVKSLPSPLRHLDQAMKYSENKCTNLAYQRAYGRKAQTETEGQLCLEDRTLWSCVEA